MKTYYKSMSFLMLFALQNSPLLAQAGKNSPTNEVSAEVRESMAQNHEKMANCLRDKTKALSECRQEMMDSCQAGEGCMMMKHGGRMKGSGAAK